LSSLQCRRFEFTYQRDPRAGENYWTLSIAADPELTSEHPDAHLEVTGDDGDRFTVLVSIPCDSSGNALLDGSGAYQQLAFRKWQERHPGAHLSNVPPQL